MNKIFQSTSPPALAFLYGNGYLAVKKRYGMLHWLKKIFLRDSPHQKDGVGERLHIDGTQTSLTAVPDEAEVAAEALLASLANERQKAKSKNQDAPEPRHAKEGTAEYYRELAERVKEAQETEARLTLRRIAYCEQELHNPLLNAEQLAELERGLYRHMDAVDREGGELKKRWQHVLAEVVIKETATQTQKI